MTHLHRYISKLNLVGAIGHLIRLNRAILSYLTVYKAPIRHFDCLDNLCLSRGQVFNVAQIHFDAEFVQGFKLIAVSIILVVLTIDHLTVQLA